MLFTETHTIRHYHYLIVKFLLQPPLPSNRIMSILIVDKFVIKNENS